MAASARIPVSGMISVDDFIEGAKRFVAVSNTLCDEWELVIHHSSSDLVYLKKKVLKSLHFQNEANEGSDAIDACGDVLSGMELSELEDDSAILEQFSGFAGNKIDTYSKMELNEAENTNDDSAVLQQEVVCGTNHPENIHHDSAVLQQEVCSSTNHPENIHHDSAVLQQEVVCGTNHPKNIHHDSAVLQQEVSSTNHPENIHHDSAVLQQEVCSSTNHPENIHHDSAVLQQEVGSTSSHNKEHLCSFEYWVIYSASYSVPVLYVNAYKSCGRLLSLEEMWGCVPAGYRHRLREDRWTFITQGENPVTGLPVFQLHPCHTGDLMAAFAAAGADAMEGGSSAVNEGYGKDETCTEQDEIYGGEECRNEASKNEECKNEECSNGECKNDTVSDTELHFRPPNTYCAKSDISKCEHLDEESKDESMSETCIKTGTLDRKIVSHTETDSHHGKLGCMGYRYLVSWLSAMGPVLHLDLPLAYAEYV